MRGKVVQVDTAHHPLVGHVGCDEAVAVEGEVADGVSGTQGESTLVKVSSLETEHVLHLLPVSEVENYRDPRTL